MCYTLTLALPARDYGHVTNYYPITGSASDDVARADAIITLSCYQLLLTELNIQANDDTKACSATRDSTRLGRRKSKAESAHGKSVGESEAIRENTALDSHRCGPT